MLKIKNIFLYKKLAYKQHKQYMLFRLLKYFIDIQVEKLKKDTIMENHREFKDKRHMKIIKELINKNNGYITS